MNIVVIGMGNDDYSVRKDANAILLDVQSPTAGGHVPRHESLREVSARAGRHIQPNAFSAAACQRAGLIYRGVGKGR